ncbi:MAG: HAMP domain-containing histidine kinase [Niabella sp.]|nr:HAMP domain-containing histidine kinase [Niabella sp.]
MNNRSYPYKLFLYTVFFIISLNATAQLAAIRNLQERLPFIKDSTAYVDALNKLGLLYYQKTWDSCYYYGKKANDIAKRIHYPPGIAGSLNVLGIYYSSTNRYLATRYYNQSLQLYQQLQDTANIGQLYNNLAVLSQSDNDLGTATRLLRQANDITRSLQRDSIRAVILLNWSMTDTTLSYSSADSLRGIAQQIIQKYQDTLLLRYLTFLRLTTDLNTTKSDKSIAQLEDFARVLEADESNYLLPQVYTALAGAFAQKGNKNKALFYNNQALFRAQLNKNHSIIIFALESLKQFYADSDDYKNAYKYASLISEEKERQQEYLKKSGYTYTNYVLREKNLQLAQNRSAAEIRIIIISAILLVVLLIAFIAIFWLYKKSHQSATVQQQLSNTLQQHNQQLQSWDEFNNMLLGVMAHDIRQPFASIITLSTVMEADESLSQEELRAVLHQLNEVSARGIQFMDGLLNWIKSKREDFKYAPRSLPVHEILLEANAFFASKQKEKGLRLEITDTASGTVAADKVMLTFILRNLLSNATQYAPQDSVISATITPQEQEVVISITDSGPGMEQGKLTALFSLQNNDFTSSNISKGAGLALIICHEMTKLMNGTLLAESNPGQGTTFKLALPRG